MFSVPLPDPVGRLRAAQGQRRSRDPFWWFSIGGGLCLLSYALYREDPVFILGQSAGLIVYVRNIMLLRRNRVGGAGGARS